MNFEHLSKIRANVALHTNKKTENILDGGYTSIFRGRSLDFDDLREYQPGDNVRDIDWKASSKTGKTLIRRFVAERKHNVLFLCDSGEKMVGDTPSGESKATVAENVLGTLMYLINRQGDDFALLTKKDAGVDFSYFKSGPVHFEQLMSDYEKTLAEHMTDFDRDDLEDRFLGKPSNPSFPKAEEKKSIRKQILSLFSLEGLLDSESYEPVNYNLLTLLEYCAENIRRKKVVFIITDLDGMSLITGALLKKLNVTSDVLLIEIEDCYLSGDNVYDLEKNRYEDDLLLHNKKLRKAAEEKRLIMEEEISDILSRGRVSMVKVSSEKEVIDKIVELFERHKNGNFG